MNYGWGSVALAVSAGIAGYIAAKVWSHKEVRYPEAVVANWIKESGVDVRRAVVVITGATSGIGQALATELHRLGATVILASRNLSKCKAVREEILRENPESSGAIDCFALDLVDLDTVGPFCEWFKSKYTSLTFLINNAGIHYGDKIGDLTQPIASPQGLDEVFVTNFLGHYLLTHHLLPLIQRGRVVSTSSSFHLQADGSTLRISKSQKLPSAADPHVEGMAHRKGAYGVTKLAQILHMKHLQRVLTAKGVTSVQAVSVCPGWVRTNILPPGLLGSFLRKYAYSPRAGLLSSMAAIFYPNLRGGEFVANSIAPLSTESYFPSLARKLSAWGLRDVFVDLLALCMVVLQCHTYGLNVLSGSPESNDAQLAEELCTWSEQELRRRGYLSK